MFDAIDKAKQVALIGLDRMGDYFELLSIEIEIQRHYLAEHLLARLVMFIFVFLTGIFLGFAIIVSYWDSIYRIHAAWGVMLGYALLASLSYVVSSRKKIDTTRV